MNEIWQGSTEKVKRHSFNVHNNVLYININFSRQFFVLRSQDRGRNLCLQKLEGSIQDRLLAGKKRQNNVHIMFMTII